MNTFIDILQFIGIWIGCGILAVIVRCFGDFLLEEEPQTYRNNEIAIGIIFGPIGLFLILIVVPIAIIIEFCQWLVKRLNYENISFTIRPLKCIIKQSKESKLKNSKELLK